MRTDLPDQTPPTAASKGPGELIVGRDVFTESFPLFGYDLADQDALFAAKLELLLKLNAAERVTWQGRFRPALHDAPISPRPAQSRLPIWVGTGGTQGSIIRAGTLGLPLALANISIPPAQLAPMSDLYRRTGMQAGHDARNLKLSIATHMHVQENSQNALNEFYPQYASYFRNHTPAHFRAQQITRADYEERASPHGALFVGSPQQIIDKILYERELFGHQRFLAQIDIGGLPFAKVARVIELFSTKIAPVFATRSIIGQAHEKAIFTLPRAFPDAGTVIERASRSLGRTAGPPFAVVKSLIAVMPSIGWIWVERPRTRWKIKNAVAPESVD